MQPRGEKGEVSSNRPRGKGKQMREIRSADTAGKQEVEWKGLRWSYVTYIVWNYHGSKGIHNQYQTAADNRRAVKHCDLKTSKSYSLYITVLHAKEIQMSSAKLHHKVFFKNVFAGFFLNSIKSWINCVHC